MKKYLLLATVFTVLSQPVFAMEEEKSTSKTVTSRNQIFENSESSSEEEKPLTAKELKMYEFLKNIATNPRINEHLNTAEKLDVFGNPKKRVPSLEYSLYSARLICKNAEERETFMKSQARFLVNTKGAYIQPDATHGDKIIYTKTSNY